MNVHGIYIGEDETYTVKYIENFRHVGIHGKHYCAVFELMGPSLYDLVSYYYDSY